MDPAECARRVARGGWAEDLALHRCRFPIGPRNTFSNAGYFLAGLILWAQTGDLLMPAALLALAAGSFWYHGFKTIIGNDADWFGMYACTMVLVFQRLHALGWMPVLMALAVLTAWAIAGIRVDNFVGGVALICGVLPPWHWMNFAGLGLAGIGYICWQLDKRRSPLIGLWGHAAWHVLTGFGLMLLYLGGRAHG